MTPPLHHDLALAVFASQANTHLTRSPIPTTGRAQPHARRFAAFVDQFDPAHYLADLASRGLRFIGRSTDEFPDLLRSIQDPPVGLFLRGVALPSTLSAPSIAFVGARACSPYGSHVARALAQDIAAAGISIVSGLARGIDTTAHRGALHARGGTVAVLGCGIDRDYPAANAELAREIANSPVGLIVSEYAPGVAPAPWRFPARNRIIAGLARATLVVEARERSGSLITADFAVEFGRQLYAVPGEITSDLSAGTNALLRQHQAIPVTSAPQVIADYGFPVNATDY